MPAPGSADGGEHTGTLGAALRAAREAAGMTVEQVSAITRVRSTLVRDLEDDRLESSGGTVYARGHVRNIATAVGVDPAPLIARFDREVDPDAPPGGPSQGFGGNTSGRPAAPNPTGGGGSGGSGTGGMARTPSSGSLSERVLGIGGLGNAFTGRAERRGPNWALAGSLALVALVAIIAVGTLNSSPHATPPDTLAGGPSASPAANQEPSAAPSPLAPAAVAQLPTTTDAQLRVRTIGGASWIQVRSASATVFEGVLPAGTTRDFKDAKVLHIVVGNSGAVSLVCSGRDLGPVGGPGKISRFDCSAAGLFPA